MNEKQILEFCVKHNISIAQYFILYITKQRWEGNVKDYEDYMRRNDVFQEDLQDLLDKKMITSTNVSNEAGLYMRFIRVSDKFLEKSMDNTDMAEELYRAYPVTFPLAGGGTFVARTGMEKGKMLKLYLDKIGHNAEKHKFVMEQVARYEKLASTGKTNGNKLSVFIENEMWDTIAQIPDTTSSAFKDDV